MRPELACDAVESALEETFLARGSVSDEVLAHAEACPRCGRVRSELEALARAFAAVPTPDLDRERAARALAVASAELAQPAELTALRTSGLPVGYRRELARLVALAALPMPLALAWYALLFRVGGSLLGEILPAAVVAALGAALTAGAASWFLAIYGSLPFVAQRRALRRPRGELRWRR